MAIDPRIPLGVQPMQIQQPNMLAQYAQIMGIRAAQQEMEGNEGVRGALSQGVPDDPATLLQYGKQGRATYESLLKGRKEKLESDDKRNVMLGGLAGPVMENPTPANFEFTLNRAVNYGLMTPAQKQEVLTQYGGSPESIKSYASQVFKGSITAQAQQADITSRRGQDVTAGTTMRGQNMTDARMREQMEFERNKRSVVPGEGEFLQTDPYGNIYQVPAYGALRGPNAPAPAMPPAAANAFVATQPPTVNALAPTAPPVVQPGLPTVANALAMEQQQNVPRPRQPFTAPVPVLDENNRPVFVQGREAIGKTPATPEALKLIREEKVTKEGKESVNRVLGNLYSEYGNLVKSGGITDTRRSVEENISARTGASAAGQLAGSFTGSEAQSFRDSIEQTRPLLLTAIMKATGLSATQLNSNVELQTYLKTATDPKVSIQSNVKALNNISQMFGLGEKFDVPEIPKAEPKTAAPSGATVTTPDGRTIVFPDAAAAARFKKEAGL